MADDPVSSALERIEQHDAQMAFHAKESARWKTVVNALDELAQREPRFADVHEVSPASPATGGAGPRFAPRGWAAGEFLGMPFATAAKTVLQARFEAGGKPSPAAVDDIREALLQGTYNFGTTNIEAQKQSIRISLGKNSGVFVKLPNTDLFGLLEWYPGLRKPMKNRIRTFSERLAEADAALKAAAASATAGDTVATEESEDPFS
jgi:hypothetical protein